VSYGYDSSGNLIAFTDENGNTTQFTYLSDPAHYLNTIIGADGIQAIQTQYTSDGRISSLTGPNGQIGNYTYDLNDLSQTTYDALGNPTTTYC
jgi:YD repeat-containing protein